MLRDHLLMQMHGLTVRFHGRRILITIIVHVVEHSLLLRVVVVCLLLLSVVVVVGVSWLY